MENTMELYKKILRDRIRKYQELYDKHRDEKDLWACSAYQSALDMFKYAEAGNYDCLTQFDYLGEEEGE